MEHRWQHLLVERRGSVLRLTMNDPARRNPLSLALSEELAAALAAADSDDSVRAIVLAGAGETFSAGADLKEAADWLEADAAALVQMGRRLNRVFEWGERLRKPLIAAVQGAALGAGCALAAMCHVVLAAEDARFGIPEVRLGLFPLVVLPHVARAIGERRALELALSGRTMGAEEAHAAGLVHRVVPAAELDTAVMEYAAAVAGHNPVAVRLGLEAFAAVRGVPAGEALAILNAARSVVLQDPGFREAVRRFVAKSGQPPGGPAAGQRAADNTGQPGSADQPDGKGQPDGEGPGPEGNAR